MAVDRETNYEIGDVLGTNSLGGLTDENLFGEDTLDPTNTLLLGPTQRTSTAFGRTATVKAGEDIRPALESLKSAGGGTLILLAGVHKPTYDIVGDSKISIIGEGVDQTIIDFGGSARTITYQGSYSAPTLTRKYSFKLADFTVQNNGTLPLIDIGYSFSFSLENIKADSGYRGITISGSSLFSVRNCLTTNMTTDGLYIESDTVASTTTFTVEGHTSQSCGNDGILIYSNDSPYNTTSFSLINCVSTSNTTYGIRLQGNGTSGSAVGICSLINCRASGNSSYQMFIEAVDVAVLGGYLDISSSLSVGPNNTQAVNIVGMTIEGTVSFDPAQGSMIGCRRGSSAGSQWATDTNAGMIGINDGTTKTERRVISMKNTSGGSLTAGNVVTYKAVAAGDEITTTTTQGDDLIFGMCLESHANNAYETVLTEGFTQLLKVDGTTDIAVGDFLGAFTTAGIAMKAAAGDMAFAIALESYSTNDSLGVIDALIISPRKI